jgi:hypothetical protein
LRDFGPGTVLDVIATPSLRIIKTSTPASGNLFRVKPPDRVRSKRTTLTERRRASETELGPG